MKKTVKGVCLLVAVCLISSSLAACSFFETPSQQTAPSNAPAVETPAAENPDAVTDEAWSAPVGHYVELEKDYARVKKAYDNSLIADNPDMASMLERAEEIIATMGETKHSQLTNADAADLEKLTREKAVYRYLPTFLFEQKYADPREVIARMDAECFDTKESMSMYFCFTSSAAGSALLRALISSASEAFSSSPA